MQFFSRPALAATLVLLAGSSVCAAATVTARFDATLGGSVQRIIADSTTGSQGWTALSVGRFTLTQTGGELATNNLLPNPDNTFLAFCGEPQEPIFVGQTYTFAVSPLRQMPENTGGMGQQRADFVNRLLHGVNQNVINLLSADMTRVQAAALQIALWEIIRETQTGNAFSTAFSITAGNTRFRNPFDAAALTNAQSWLDRYVNHGASGPKLTNTIALIHPTNQDLLAFMPIENFSGTVQATAISAPSPLGLLIAGFVSLGTVLRRKTGLLGL